MDAATELQRTLPSNLVVKQISQRGHFPTLATRVRDVEDEQVRKAVYDAYIAVASNLNRYRVDMGNGYVFMCDDTGDDNLTIDDGAYDNANAA